MQQAHHISSNQQMTCGTVRCGRNQFLQIEFGLTSCLRFAMWFRRSSPAEAPHTRKAQRIPAVNAIVGDNR